MGIAILIVEVSLLSALWIQMKKMAFQRMFFAILHCQVIEVEMGCG